MTNEKGSFIAAVEQLDNITMHSIKPSKEFDEDEIIQKEFEEILDDCLDISTDHMKIACILDECKKLLLKKGEDYNRGRVKMGDYYPRGLHSVVDVMNGKLLRLYSLLESGKDPNFESIEDTAKDLINYAGIFIGVARGLIETPASRNTPNK